MHFIFTVCVSCVFVYFCTMDEDSSVIVVVDVFAISD